MTGAHTQRTLDVGPLEPLAPTPRFLEMASDLGIAFDEGDLARLGLFLAILLDVNAHTNLTAIRDPAEAWIKHVLDSLTLLPILSELDTDTPPHIVDVGSGAGLPGIPLAIARPDAHVTLLEATAKKAEFLRLCADRLSLSNVDVVNARAESAGAHPNGKHRDRYDVVVTRAIGQLAVAAELCVPLARPGGLIALIKGQKADEELAAARSALHLLHADHAGTIDTPTGRIIVLHKTRTTPHAYPRRDGEPKRAPLGSRP
jgi:16S rRNA (guanine527-N7)-methyltransferase